MRHRARSRRSGAGGCGAVLSHALAAGGKARAPARRGARAGAVLCRAPRPSGRPADRRVAAGPAAGAGQLVVARRPGAVPARRPGRQRACHRRHCRRGALPAHGTPEPCPSCRAGRCCSASGCAPISWRAPAPGRRRPRGWPRRCGPCRSGCNTTRALCRSAPRCWTGWTHAAPERTLPAASARRAAQPYPLFNRLAIRIHRHGTIRSQPALNQLPSGSTLSRRFMSRRCQQCRSEFLGQSHSPVPSQR